MVVLSFINHDMVLEFGLKITKISTNKKDNPLTPDEKIALNENCI